MADSTNQSEQDISRQTSRIHRLIASTRRWLRSTWVATGLAVSLGLFIAVLVVVVLLDLASPLWPALRLAGLLLVLLPTAAAFLVGVVKPLVRRMTRVMVARRIEQELPGIHNRLVSCVDLARNGQARQSRSFHQRLVYEACERIRDFRLRQVLDLLSLRRASTFAFLSVAALVAAFLLFSDRLPTAVARILQPFADIPPISDVLYEVLVDDQSEPGDCDVLRGEDVDFQVVIKKGEVDPPGRPNSLRLDISTVDSKGQRKRLNYSLPEVRESRTAFKLTGMQHSFAYRVRGGGTWSKQYRVTMLDRPRIVGIQTAVYYPKYMRLPEPRLGPPQSPDVTGPRESTVEVTVDVQGDASEGEIELLEQRGTEFVATESFLLSAPSSLPDAESHSQRWSGKFPLQRDGFYRVVLRNRLKYENQQMKEGKLTALPDNPPQLVVERPAKDLVVSEPIKVPVYLTAYDDFGLDDIVLSFQMPDAPSFQGRTVRRYEPPKQNDSPITTIDLAAEGLQLNQTLRYRLEVRDTKGQSVTTEDRTIRIADDNQAADRQFAQYQEKTKSLQEKLEQLVQEQAKVEAAAEELAEKYEDLTENIEQAQADAVAQAEAAAEANQPPPAPMPIVLDEPSQQQLQELRAELAQVAPIEEKAVQLSKEVATELKQLAEQSPKLELLPPEVAEQVQGIQAAFEQLAVKPLEELNKLVKEATQPATSDPQLPEIQKQSSDVQQTLEDLQMRIAAIAKAQETSRTDVEQAVAELQQDVLQQNAKITARELTALRDAVVEMRGELSELGETQEALMADAQKDLSDPIFEKLVEAQQQLDAKAEPVLAEARELLTGDDLEQVRAEADSAATDDAPVPLKPALAGPLDTPPVDEPDQPASKKDKKSKKQTAKQQDPAAQPLSPERQELQTQQAERAEELATAEQALAADQEILEGLIESLASQLPEDALGAMTPEQAAQLQELLNAETTQEALEMFRRLEQMLAQADQPVPPANQPPIPSQITPQPNLTEIGTVDAILVELNEFDLNARTVIMKMQPREREDLLQGLKEEGPEGYREFIRDYFRRLTKVQSQP